MPRPRKRDGLAKVLDPQRDVPENHYRYGFHGEGRNDKCPVCAHTEVPVIELAYFDFQPEEGIATLFGGFTPQELNWHCEGLDLHNKRNLENPDAIARILTEEGVAAIRDGRVTVKPELLHRVQTHKDEKAGRMPPRLQEGGGGHTLVIANFPIPGGALPELQPTPIIARPIEGEFEETDAPQRQEKA